MTVNFNSLDSLRERYHSEQHPDVVSNYDFAGDSIVFIENESMRFAGDTVPVLPSAQGGGKFCIQCGNRMTIADHPRNVTCQQCKFKKVIGDA